VFYLDRIGRIKPRIKLDPMNPAPPVTRIVLEFAIEFKKIEMGDEEIEGTRWQSQYMLS